LKAVVGTRLNFNSLMSPKMGGVMEDFRDSHREDDNDTDEDTTPICNANNSLQKTRILQHDLHQPYVQIRTCSFPSVSTDSPSRNISAALASGEDTLHTTNTGAFTPFQFGAGVEMDRPTTTQEEHFRLHLDSTQCSPIARVPTNVELHDDLQRNTLNNTDTVSPIIDILPHHNLESHNPHTSTTKDPKPNRIRHQQSVWSSTNHRTPSPQKSTVGDQSIPHSHESSVSGCSNASSARKLRPMPDMSAFDIGSSTTMSSPNPHGESCGEGGGGVRDRRGTSVLSNPSPLKILCPPTPVRTPAWYHNGGLVRKNSLITTKILAACAQHTLDELSSFENSLMEDDTSSSPPGDNPHNSLSVSFSAVREEDSLETNHAEPSGGGLAKHPHPLESHGTGTRKRRSSRSSLKSTRSTTGLDTEMSGGDTPSKGSNKPTHKYTGLDEVGAATISFESDFENLGCLGRGAFADVFKARSRSNSNLYAVKRNRRQFRGKNDRDRAMAEVHIMQRLQSAVSTHERNAHNVYFLYVLHFIRAWQEDGHLFCQTELCCRDTCQQLMESLTTNWEASSKLYPSLVRNLPLFRDDKCGHLVPEPTIWKIFHDVTAGLSHMHSHGIVHQDIKPLNIFFVSHPQLGALCKIGDFGIAGDIGTVEDGQEGDTIYMPQELLTTPVKEPSGDIFSLGLTMYELSSSATWTLPTEGARWHDIRNGAHVPELPPSRSKALISLIQRMISSNKDQRPGASQTLVSNEKMNSIGMEPDSFLSEYIRDVQNFDQAREKEVILAQLEDDKSRHTPTPLVSRRSSSG